MTDGNRPLHSSHVDPLVFLHRTHMLLYSAFLLLHFRHLFRTLHSSPSLPTALLLAADLVLAFVWVLTQSLRWRPIHRREYPNRLMDQIGGPSALPKLDVFVCTADPYKEPPMGVVNTVLAVMGFDYPMEKLSVYVSDDGGSELTLFAFVEAAHFARRWLPFCRDCGVEVRSPEVFFQRTDLPPSSHEMKVLYERMKDKVEGAVKKGFLDDGDLHSMAKDGRQKTFKKWKTFGFHPKEHPSVVEILLDGSKDVDTGGNPMPNLVYVSREKNRSYPHHFKAGALNAMLRVSHVMTNGPIVLTLDCDTTSTDRGAPHRALCYLLDKGWNSNLAYVQFPQRFSSLNRDDTYGGRYTHLFFSNCQGMDGYLGPNYLGSCTFFSRRALHDTCRDDDPPLGSQDQESMLEIAHQVACCNVEEGTGWGSKVGFRYGSLVEDFYTGLQLQMEGWRSVFCNPQKAAFLGDAPMTLLESLSQVRRWTVGLLEVVFSGHCPLLLLPSSNSSLAMLGMNYSHYCFWPFWSIPMLTYAILPQLALVYKLPLFPKVNDPRLLIYCYLFVVAYMKDLMDFLRAGGTYRWWWNDQRMWMIRGVTSFPLGFLEYSLKHLGFPGLGFTVTAKVVDEKQSLRYHKGVLELGPMSPFVVSVGVVAIVNLVSLVLGFARAVVCGCLADFAVQLMLSAFVVVNCMPIYEAMAFRRDEGRMERDGVVRCFFLAAILYAVGWWFLEGPR